MDSTLFIEEFEAVGLEDVVTDWGEVLPSVEHSIWLYQKYLAEAQTSFFATLPLRALQKITIDLQTGCWVWEAGRDNSGYGQIWDERTDATAQAHRYIFERMVRPLVPGEKLDHRCRCHPCVWPVHTHPKTHAQNVKAGVYDRRHVKQPHFWQPFKGS